MPPVIKFQNPSIDSSALLPSVQVAGSSMHNMLLRQMPLLQLVQMYIDSNTNRSMEFLEEARLPVPVVKFLSEAGIQPGNHPSFFLDDRSPYRYGILVVRNLPGDQPTKRNYKLAVELNQFIKKCGWQDDRFLIEALPELNLLPNRFLNQEMACLLVWEAQALPGEARPYNRGLPELDISQNLLASQSAIRASTASTEIENLPEIVAAPDYRRVTAKPAILPEHSTPATAGAQKVSNLTQVSGSGPLRNFVIGHSRGGPACKYFLRRDKSRIRLSILTAAHLSPEFVLAFFDHVQYSTDIVRSHRDVLQAAFPAGVHSFSIDMQDDGRFRAIVHGMRPLLWRQKERKAHIMPDTTRVLDAHGRRQIKQVRGQLKTGDALIFLPEVLDRDTMLELVRELRKVGNLTGQMEFRNLLGDWLDTRNCGRALLIDHQSVLAETV